MREAVRYEDKNMKWTAAYLRAQVVSQANALVDLEYQKGDSIAVWFPESAERHVTMLAAAMIGLRLFEIDRNIDNFKQVREFLTASQCRSLFFKPYDGEQDNLMLLRRAIPEFFEYDDAQGQLFHSKHFPALHYFIQSGIELEPGCLPYYSMFLPNPTDELALAAAAAVDDAAPFYTYISKDNEGVKISPTLTRAQVLDHPNWAFAKRVMDWQYFEVPLPEKLIEEAEVTA